MTVPTPRAFAADPAECRDFLDAYPGIRFFDVFFTNLSGVSRGKRLRCHEIEAVYRQGRFLPGSILVMDITGRDVTETGLVWEKGDADRTARPVPGGITPAPWLGDDVGQVMMSLHEADGGTCELDPRAVLQKVLERFAADDMVPVVACELEYYIVDAKRRRDGGVRLPHSSLTGQAPRETEAYSLSEIEELAPFLRGLWAACDAQAIPLEGVISEASPGQIELTLKHRADAMRAADDAVAYKRAAKGVARRHGLEATFMAKPWSTHAGSGLHLHASVENDAGVNLMASEDPGGGPLLRHAIGGMKALLGESMAIFAPNANSFRRFRANSYAPIAPTWGIDNRTVALRIPSGPPANRHVEHRVAGADANPYLALAAMLAGMHHGITNAMDPGDPVRGNGYAQPHSSGSALPSNWFAAVDSFDRSAVLRDYLGDHVVDMFACVKRAEQDRFFEQVTTLDYDWYLRNA